MVLNIFLSVIFCSFLVVVSFSQTTAIAWEKDFKNAQLLARQNGRPMLLDFTADWCKPCKAMDREFWVLPEVVGAVETFVAVKIDYDSEKSLASRFGVAAIPYVVFTDPLGNVVTWRRGFSKKSVNDLNAILAEMPRDFSSLKEAYEALELDKNDGKSLLKIADAYRGWKMVTLSNEFYKKALKSSAFVSDQETSDRILATIATNWFLVRNYHEALKASANYLEDFPTGKNREVALYIGCSASAANGKIKNAVQKKEALGNEFPASKFLARCDSEIEIARGKK